MLNGVDLYYQVNLPKIFGAEHPLGTVLGKAEYGNKLFVYQGVTVGGNKMKYPKIGENVTMYSNSKILGNAVIGNNVAVSANTYIKGEKIPNNCLVFGTSPNLVIVGKSEEEISKYLTAFY